MKSFFNKIRHKAIVRNICIPENATMLDTSCQDGSFLKVLVENNPNKNLKLFGIDIDEKGIEKAKAIFPKENFILSDNTSIPFPDKSFDIVISSMTLHHMSDPLVSIAEMKRVLKDGGCIYLIDLMASKKIFYSILKHFKCWEPYHFEKFYLLKDVEGLLSKNQLKITKIDKVIIFPTTTIMMPLLVLQIGIK